VAPVKRGLRKLVLSGAVIACGCVLAGSASAVTPAATASTRPPSTALTDPADTNGPLDLRTVHLTQNLGQIRWAFKTSRKFRLIDMSAGSASRTACLDIGPRGMPKKLAKLCITGTSAKQKALYRSAANAGGAPKAGFVAATITRIDRSHLEPSHPHRRQRTQPDVAGQGRDPARHGF
jgi:hypothetical protein